MTLQKVLLAAAVAGSAAGAARADAIFPNFIVPAFVGQANSTYQEWGAFTDATAGNAPTQAANSAGAASAFDATGASDGAFLTGGHIYSFSAATSPTITVPNFALGTDWTTQIVLQIKTAGSEIDLSTVKLTPAGGGGGAIGPNVTTLLHQEITSTGFGDNANDDYLFSWTVPGNASAYTLSMTASGPSMSWYGARVDTVALPAAAVPEPATLACFVPVLVGLLSRRRRP